MEAHPLAPSLKGEEGTVSQLTRDALEAREQEGAQLFPVALEDPGLPYFL